MSPVYKCSQNKVILNPNSLMGKIKHDNNFKFVRMCKIWGTWVVPLFQHPTLDVVISGS